MTAELGAPLGGGHTSAAPLAARPTSPGLVKTVPPASLPLPPTANRLRCTLSSQQDRPVQPLIHTLLCSVSDQGSPLHRRHLEWVTIGCGHSCNTCTQPTLLCTHSRLGQALLRSHWAWAHPGPSTSLSPSCMPVTHCSVLSLLAQSEKPRTWSSPYDINVSSFQDTLCRCALWSSLCPKLQESTPKRWLRSPPHNNLQNKQTSPCCVTAQVKRPNVNHHHHPAHHAGPPNSLVADRAVIVTPNCGMRWVPTKPSISVISSSHMSLPAHHLFLGQSF